MVYQHFNIIFWYEYSVHVKKVNFDFLEGYDPDEINSYLNYKQCADFVEILPPSLEHYYKCFETEYSEKRRRKNVPPKYLQISKPKIYDIIRKSKEPIQLDEAIKIGWIYKRYMNTLEKITKRKYPFDLAEYFCFLNDYYDLA